MDSNLFYVRSRCPDVCYYIPMAKRYEEYVPKDQKEIKVGDQVFIGSCWVDTAPSRVHGNPVIQLSDGDPLYASSLIAFGCKFRRVREPHTQVMEFNEPSATYPGRYYSSRGEEGQWTVPNPGKYLLTEILDDEE